MMISTQIKTFEEMSSAFPGPKPKDWEFQAIVNDDNLTYVIHHPVVREAIIVDPMREDLPALQQIARTLIKNGTQFIAVFDTHTHADHISCAYELARLTDAPWVLHKDSPSPRIDIRSSRDTRWPSKAAPFKILMTPGHTPDGTTLCWGPWVMTGDTLFVDDTGRNDLPGGDPETHFETIEKYKKLLTPDQWILPGHDGKGGRIASWGTVLEINPMVKMDRATFVREAGSYIGPSPKQLKESLYENFR